MKATVFIEPGRVEVKEVDKPQLQSETDVIIRVLRTCVCGSDLWWYRGISKRDSDTLAGHEAIGIVDEVGREVTSVAVGDFVVVPFTHGCGYCVACCSGFDGNCQNNPGAHDIGYQAEYVRYYNANGGLVKIPGQPSDYSEDMLNSLLTLSDVMATGYHAAITAEVKKGDTVLVLGDGAVGLCGILSAKLLGAKRIIATSRHHNRKSLALAFGATDIIEERGNEAVKHLLDLTDGSGVDAVLECVGTEQSVATAIQATRPGAIIGRVGVPQKSETNTTQLFVKNIGLRGGIAAVTTHVKSRLLDAVLKGDIQPGKVFTHVYSLDEIAKAYEAMDTRKAIKSLVIVD